MFPAVWSPCLAQCCRFLTIIEWGCVLLENVWMERGKKRQSRHVWCIPEPFGSLGQRTGHALLLDLRAASCESCSCHFSDLGFITCLDLSFSDLSLLKCTLGSGFFPLTLESLTNLTDITGNLWVFFCFLSTYFQTWAYQTRSVHSQNEVYTSSVQLQHPCWFHGVFT